MAVDERNDLPTDGQELLERVEQLTAAIEASADAFVRGTVDELVGAIIELYGEGLTRIVRELAEPHAEVVAAHGAGFRNVASFATKISQACSSFG